MTAPTVRTVAYRQPAGRRAPELDLYLPPEPSATIVYLHGGGWRRGSRREPLPALGGLAFYEELAGLGFAVAAADYALSGEARFPAPLHDVRAAVAWVCEHGPPGVPVYLWGESAGAHLALLAALGAGAEDGADAGGGRGGAGGRPGLDVAGVVAWYPPTDLLGLPADLAAIGAPADTGPDSREARMLGAPPSDVPELARSAAPTAYAHADAPPVLLMHGAADRMVPPAQSIRLAKALRDAGARRVELDLVPGAGHMWARVADVAGIVRRTVAFLRSLPDAPGRAAPGPGQE
ncbi:alpha/beta hydrolase [Embleya scabrispora]|uniref:alpha/beta hydrolase n=1 Tax=Embleya scabrispora TaxID=159449 RepID=UPI001374D28F|nr:alpha/beta hydrolase fold domain-containing protein [Embleya scabrispora]